MEIRSEWDVQKKETRFTGMQKVKKNLKSAQSRVTCVVKANATGNGRREQSLWWGEVREGSLEREFVEPQGRVGAGQALRRAAEASGKQDHIGGKAWRWVWEQTASRLKDSCSFFKCLFKFNSVPRSLPSITVCG